MASSGSPLPQMPVIKGGLPTMADTQGVFLAATFIGLSLYGISLHQAFTYSRTSRDDTLILKVLVACVMLFETFHVFITIHTCFHYLILSHMVPLFATHSPWSIDILPAFSGGTMFLSQLFLARRVYMVGPRHRLVVVAAMILLAGEVGFSIAAAVRANLLDSFLELKDVTLLSGLGLALAMLGESCLTLPLTLAFRKSRKMLPPREDKVEATYDFLQLYLINTGLITCIFNLVGFVVALARPNDFVCVSLNIITTRLYGNSLLSVLNSRNMAGMEILATKSQTLWDAFIDAEQKAKREQWLVPQLPLRRDVEGAVINVEVEMESDVGYGDKKHRELV